MGFRIKRIDYEEDFEGYLTENDEYGVLEEAKTFENRWDAEDILEDPPWDNTGDYEYIIEEE